MKLRTTLILMFGIILFVPMISAGWFDWLLGNQEDISEQIENDNQLGNLTIQSLGRSWNIVQHSGLQKDNFNITNEDLGDGKARICLIPKTPMFAYDDDKIQQSKVTTFNKGNLSRTIEPSSMETEIEYGEIKSLCINVDKESENKVQFGNQTSIIIYQSINMLNYKLEDCEINITLFKNISGNYENTVTNIFIESDNKTLKFGAKDKELRNVFNNYKYEFDSSCQIEKENWFTIYLKDNGIHKIDLSDLTDTTNYKANFTQPYLNLNCNSNYSCEAYFNSDKFIDPSVEFFLPINLTNIQGLRREGTSTGFYHMTAKADDGMLFYDTFERGESGNTSFDYTTNNYDGVITNAVITDSGKYMRGIDTDGSGDYINYGDINAFEFGTNDFTISAWFRPEGLHNLDILSRGAIISKWRVSNSGKQWALLTHSTQMNFWTSSNGFNNQGISKVITIPLNVWQNVVITGDGTTLRMYMNGTEIHNGAYSGTTTGKTTEVYVGSVEEDMISPDWIFNGKIDEVMIYNRELSPSEVEDIYDESFVRFAETGNATKNSNTFSDDFTNNMQSHNNFTKTYQTGFLFNALDTNITHSFNYLKGGVLTNAGTFLIPDGDYSYTNLWGAGVTEYFINYTFSSSKKFLSPVLYGKSNHTINKISATNEDINCSKGYDFNLPMSLNGNLTFTGAGETIFSNAVNFSGNAGTWEVNSECNISLESGFSLER